MQPPFRPAPLRAHSTPEPDIPPPPEGDPLAPPPEKPPHVDPVPVEEPTPPPPPVTVLAATAGTIRLDAVPPNAFVAPFLPGDAAARRASVVICNGGSPTSQQALTAGVPVIGIAGNLDQFLNMHGVVGAGAGLLLRADRFQETALRRAATRLLDDSPTRLAARQLATAFQACLPGPRLRTHMQALLQ